MGKSPTLENKDVRPGHLGRATPARSPPPGDRACKAGLQLRSTCWRPSEVSLRLPPPPQAPGSPNPHLTYFLECGCVLNVTFPT